MEGEFNHDNILRHLNPQKLLMINTNMVSWFDIFKEEATKIEIVEMEWKTWL